MTIPKTEHRVFLNSLPKSGTFLLSRTLELLGYQDCSRVDRGQAAPLYLNYRQARRFLEASGLPPEPDPSQAVHVGTQVPVSVPVTLMREWLSWVPSGEFFVAHVSHSPALSPLLEALNYRHVFIIRDPRAVIPSLLSFILNTRGLATPHFLEGDMKDKPLAERLDLILRGGHAERSGMEIQSFDTIYRAMLAWQREPSCLLVRFEDLVGPMGGGDRARQLSTVARIAAHLGLPFDDAARAKVDSIYSPASPTFRLGQIDSWRQTMDPVLVERLIQYCQPLCEEAGYATE